MNQTLPFALAIASKTTELDNIKVVPLLNQPKLRKIVRVFRIGNWRDRIINSSAQALNKDIKQNILKNPNVVFYPYVLGFIQKGFFFVRNKMYYEIK